MRGTPSAEVTLGDHTLPVYAQRHAYLANRLGRFIDSLLEGMQEIDAAGLLNTLQEQSYELLCVLIPNLEKRCPEYEFRGFSSREALEAGDYDEHADKSPTLPEIREAFTVAARVNAFDVLAHLKGIIDPSLLRGVVNAQLAEAISGSPSLQNSRSANGTSDSTSSGTTPPATTASEG